MADLLDSIRAQLRTRLDELRPLVGAYERLQAAEAALAGGSSTGTRAGQSERRASRARRGGARRLGLRQLSSVSGEREANRETVLALVRERPGFTTAELNDTAGLSSAGVTQNLRRMLDRGEVREEALPGGTTGYRIADDRPPPRASGREGQTSQ